MIHLCLAHLRVNRHVHQGFLVLLLATLARRSVEHEGGWLRGRVFKRLSGRLVHELPATSVLVAEVERHEAMEVGGLLVSRRSPGQRVWVLAHLILLLP